MMSAPSKAVVLIGLRGAGKTSLGRRLAETLGLRFEDLDDLALADCAEASIAKVFSSRGESAWRTAEAHAFSSALSRGVEILALGGGAPMTDAIRDRLQAGREAGTLTVIWLDAPDAILAERIGAHDDARPALLSDEDGQEATPEQETSALRERRAPVFAALADTLIDTTAAPSSVLEDLVKAAGS